MINNGPKALDVRTLNQIFFKVVERDYHSVMLFRRGPQWAPISSRELYRYVAGTARTLLSWGIGKGERVAILSENRPEWAVADFATMALGAVVVPIYPTLTADQSAQLLSDSGARIVFVSTVEQLRKVLSTQGRTALEKVVVMDDVSMGNAVPMRSLINSGPQERDPEFDARALAVAPDAIATIIYTSGTTGAPKGAMLTQGNLASNLLYSLDYFDLQMGRDLSISFLPLCHITARHLDYAMFYRGVTVAYCPFLDDLLPSLQQVRPTIFVAVPRVYEKIYNMAQSKIGSGLKRKLYNWAMGVGRKYQDEVLAGRPPAGFRWNLADWFLFSKLKQALGGRVTLFISGGAPLNHELARWYACLGIRIYEGYGLTETSPVIALNSPRAYKLGSVGQPLENLEVRIDDDGEILVKGPSVFQGYWNLPEETARAFSDGWFRTGDIGTLDAEGFLSITDRKKDLIKTSGGKFIAPQPIEGQLKTHTFIAEAAVIGDRRKFPLVIIAPNFPALEQWACEHGVRCSSREELIAHEKVITLYWSIVETVNQPLAQYEKLKKVLLVPDEFSIADDTLTPTMKLKRRVVEQRYRRQIDQLYAEGVNEIVNA